MGIISTGVLIAILVYAIKIYDKLDCCKKK